MEQENYTNINIFKKVYENREVACGKNNLLAHNHHSAGMQHHGSQFNPYVNNQGTTVGKCQQMLINQHFEKLTKFCELRLTIFYSNRW